MILNTQTIIGQIVSKKDIVKNPLEIREEQLLLKQEAIEKNLQDKVSMIFKDTKYYKDFQEAALTEPVTPPTVELMTDSQKRKKEEEEKKQREKERLEEKRANQELKSALWKTGVGTAAAVGTSTLINAGLNAGIKGVGWAAGHLKNALS